MEHAEGLHSRVKVSWLDDFAVLRLSGEWDLWAKETLHDALWAIGDNTDLVIDAREASFFDSSALGELIASWRRLKRNGKRFEMLAETSNMERLLDLTDLRSLFVPSSSRLAFLSERLKSI